MKVGCNLTSSLQLQHWRISWLEFNEAISKSYKKSSFERWNVYRWLYLILSSLATNWSYGWSRFSTAVHPPPPYQPPQYPMHATMATTTYGLKQPPQTIHLLQNNTREVRWKINFTTLTDYLPKLSVEYVTRIRHGHVTILQWTIAWIYVGKPKPTSKAVFK